MDISNREQRRFGTAGPFANLFQEAWKEDLHVFAAEGGKQGQEGDVQRLGVPERASSDTLNRHPVEVFAVEETSTSVTLTADRYWARWMDKCKSHNLPDYVIVSTPPKELVTDDGLQSKPWRRRFQDWGYEAHYWFLRAHEHGGVVRQDRCLLVLRRMDEGVPAIRVPEQIDTSGGARTARNMLQPAGVPWSAWERETWTPRTDYPEWVSAAASPCVILGETDKHKVPVFSPDGCFPDSVGALVSTDRGLRRLQVAELAKAKGVPPAWVAQGDMTTRAINDMTSLHLWAAAAASIYTAGRAESQPLSTPAIPLEDEPEWRLPEEEDLEWLWTAPDLSVGGRWHTARVESLMIAIAGRPDETELRTEGLAALDIHRKNYEGNGKIHQLQLLWWEFPPEHWEELRSGCPMNFMSEPREGVTSNAPMTDEQVDIAAAFIDELWHIGVFELIPEGCEMRANAPLFAVSKPGQPGQWRIIADMKNGGQNEHIGKDPVHLPRARGILERLYTGGWSAVVDASKFFHNFPTLPSDRPYLGCIHPKTGQKLWYLGLPMGSSQSPALACRYGLSMLRVLAEKEPAFQGKVLENGWRSKLTGEPANPHLGTGLIRMGRDGLPAALIWGFVDDFKLHAPTKAKLITALNAFMDLALRLGLICQEVKTKPPAQVQKYCGFIYDTTGIPTLRIPTDKQSRAVSMIQFLRAGGPSLQLSRLTLAVVTGLLQSLVEATPQRIGQTFLRRLYDRLHGLGEGELVRAEGADFFYTRVALSPEEWLDLDWWESALKLDIKVQAFSSRQGTLGVSYGDGSGSGTGGTVQVVGHSGPCPTMEAWMGTWRPRVHSFSSNWKELRTLVHTLEREVGGTGRFHNATLFYFTDNLVTYYIVTGGSSTSGELQILVRRLKYVELRLGIRLEVVHIPGSHMIDQRTDGLSRGIRLAGGRLKRSPEEETQRIFESVPVTTASLEWALERTLTVRRHPVVKLMDGTQHWNYHQISGQATIWFPAPEWAHQVMDAVVNAWTEQPWDTEAFFVVPRVFQREWGRVSKHILEIGTYGAALVPVYGVHTDIPVVFLHLPCYVRSLPPRRLDAPTRPQGEKWHWAQAEYVRGLS